MNEIKNILIEGTGRSPDIDFNKFTGELILFGKSIPENAAKVYEPLLTWINEYIKAPKQVTNLRLHLDYFNSSSLIWIAKMVKALSHINLEDSVLYIHLYFDIEDYDSSDQEDLKSIIGSLVDNIAGADVSIGIKTYGTDNDGKVLKESTIFI